MGGENAEVVRRVFEQIGAGDFESWRELFSEDVVWDVSNAGAPGRTRYEGHQGLVEFFTDWVGTWEDPSVELVEAIEFGDAVMVAFRWRGRGKGSGIDVDATFYAVYELRDGRIVRYRGCDTREEALEAARTG